MSQQKSKKLFLYECHKKHGGLFVDFAGYKMPIKYEKGILFEHAQCRNKAALFDVSHMGQILITGNGAVNLIKKLCPANIDYMDSRDSIYKMTYTMFLNEDGGIIDDTILTKIDKSILAVVNASSITNVLNLINRYVTSVEEEVNIEVINNRVILALQGPKAVNVITEIYNTDRISELSFLQSMHLSYENDVVWISRCGYTGEDGFELSIPESIANSIMNRLLHHPDVSLAGLGSRDILRLEAGLLLYGQDIDDSKTPVDAGLSMLIAKSRRLSADFNGFSKIIDQIKNKPDKVIRGFAFTGRQPVRNSAILTLESESEKENIVGHITSGVYSPSLGPIGIGYCCKSVKIGDSLFAWQRGKPHEATRVSLPFISSNTVKQ